MTDDLLATDGGARSAAEIETDRASRYLQQLCKHFAHKRPVTFDPHAGRISLSAGDCALVAEDTTLRLSLTAADPEQMARLQDTVERHLLRFAFREDMKIDWHAA